MNIRGQKVHFRSSQKISSTNEDEPVSDSEVQLGIEGLLKVDEIHLKYSHTFKNEVFNGEKMLTQESNTTLVDVGTGNAVDIIFVTPANTDFNKPDNKVTVEVDAKSPITSRDMNSANTSDRTIQEQSYLPAQKR